MESLSAILFRSGRILGRSCVQTQLRSQFQRPAGPRAFYSTTIATSQSPAVTNLLAPSLSYSQKPDHVALVAQRLEADGILKITLGFQDDESQYLEKLIRSLHARHGHQLPIAHSATRGWFWDVRPSRASFQTANHQARSETMEDFPWHTDCSYEYPPPRFFALQVLQPDRRGGGTLSVMSAARLGEHLDGATLATLMRPSFRIAIPTEFVKDPAARPWIRGRLIVADPRSGGAPVLMIRFREDIVTPLDAEAAAALDRLRTALRHLAAQDHSTLHLSPEDLPARSIILIDNRRWLHARNRVADPERHLRRVRWDAAPISGLEDEERSEVTSSAEAAAA
ncbi:hypothetical protein LMH87_002132 [Akanthomyces muscarius]|uniref:TauD/TfdA-like domain-containing protein n=1 Tax=Akanthomyces muscarius TaxID=2231603 RepID=A0A9W8Q7Q1_AKAMU|nr:hypothetical protein LMH87_002132 [Akanthomyces muscarius]KAJ4147620.1 hypothetical protein LMH87_002132 [Akanthomyces muscarius]